MKQLALHETMELHEVLNFKTVCIAKSKMIQGVVFDQKLKELLEKDVNLSIEAITMLQSLLGNKEVNQEEVQI